MALQAGAATLTSVAASASSTSILAANTARRSFSVYNDSSAVLYLKLGATASTSSYTVQVAAGGFYECPAAWYYQGAVDGIWASATGNARVTEVI